MMCDKTELALLALPPDMRYLVVESPTPVIAKNAATIAASYRIIRFKGRAMIEVCEPYAHFIPLTREYFTHIANQLLGWVKQSHINNVFAYVISTVPDLSCNDRFVLFGNLADTKTDLTVWDMDTLEVRSDIAPQDCVRRSPFSMIRRGNEPIPFIMHLAGGDEGMYGDIMQSIAPLIMTMKPEGAIWWVGDDDSGKSVLMDALYRIFPGQLVGITNKRLAGGHITRNLNGKLGNIVDSDNAQVEDVGIYRTIVKHQTFRVHNYHRQNGLEIQGNTHHIFSAKSVPTFTKKTWSTHRRTFAIPFSQQIQDTLAPTFTDEFFSQLITEMCSYANRIKSQGYRYDWSAATLAAKTDYSARSKKLDMVTSRPSLILAGRW